MLRPQALHLANGHGTSADAGASLLGHRLAVVPRRRSTGSTQQHSGWSRKGTIGGGVKCSALDDSRTVRRSTSPDAGPRKVKAVLTVQLTVGGLLSNFTPSGGLDIIGDLIGNSIYIELVSAQLDPKTGVARKMVGDYVTKASTDEDTQKYEGELTVPAGFGEIGAVLVTNGQSKEMFLKDVVISGYGNETKPVTFRCNSWVQSKSVDSRKRVFFSDKAYLPSQTPSGLQKLREEELMALRGDGKGERKPSERIYDYDVYNDLGQPDKDKNLARPVLGGSGHPYPRRCRTGRPRTKKDPMSESRDGDFYVPRDESFSEVKQVTFSARTVKSVLNALVPTLEATIDSDQDFPLFSSIDKLYNEGVDLGQPDERELLIQTLPRLVKKLSATKDYVLRFGVPELLERDRFSWLRDEEFAREALAGLNPFSIQLVTEFPFVSKLDPKIYGPPESLITKEIIEREMEGMMTLEEVIEAKRLFIIDYHDLLLPYVNKVRELPGTTLYGSRTVFFLTGEGTLMPIAIELTRPKSPKKPQWRKVFTNSSDGTSNWLWRLAKVHVAAHDSGYHQLVIHWLRTHCCTEPYIIAAHRQLSEMHPIFRLLHPHFRYTMDINAEAREALINAGGIIESSFSPGEYSMELSSVAYDKLWRFDQEALPVDLIRRGMAVEDPTAEHGLRLTIKDYPFANDGLLIWAAIKEWVQDYVTHYYADANAIMTDKELNAWWGEVRTKGHADKKDEAWWPKLETPADLVGIVTTMIWVASGHHAAVNFGQYHYAGYFPNRPSIARTNMPVEENNNSQDWERFVEKPEATLMKCLPSKIQATKVMAVLNVLSTHNPDEEYIGGLPAANWGSDMVIKAAYERFTSRLKVIEGIIDQRNSDANLKNRFGVGVMPYELLKPFSKPGVTGMGVPNSISI